jgi:DNA repair protein RadA/Sms
MSGHLTKEGSVAGPKVLEHSVDVVLQLDGDSSGAFRTLHGLKNRFGSTNEMAVFEMRENGLIEVLDPSSGLIAERPKGVPGSVVVPIIEGTRPLLVEVQSLVSQTGNSFEPRRTATGIELNRLVLISAVLSKRSLVDLKGKDIIVNVVGGIRVSETAADLGIALAIASSALDKEFPSNMAAVGELGLTGEIRRSTYIERRIIELARLGFEKVLVPASFVQGEPLTEVNIKLVGVNNIQDAIKKI